MENVLQFAKQNEASLWLFLIVIVFAIVLLNLYLRQRLKIMGTTLRMEKNFFCLRRKCNDNMCNV